MECSFFVDNVPIRVFPNIEAETGVPYLHNQSMTVYATIWDGDSWATEGGRIKINWTHAPFVASYREFSADACTDTNTNAASECASLKWWNQYKYQALDNAQLGQLKWVQENMTVYNYCTDYARYNVTPPECLHSTPISLGTPYVAPSTSTATAPSSPSPINASPSSSVSQTLSRMNKFTLTLYMFLSSLCIVM